MKAQGCQDTFGGYGLVCSSGIRPGSGEGRPLRILDEPPGRPAPFLSWWPCFPASATPALSQGLLVASLLEPELTGPWWKHFGV